MTTCTCRHTNTSTCTHVDDDVVAYVHLHKYTVRTWIHHIHYSHISYPHFYVNVHVRVVAHVLYGLLSSNYGMFVCCRFLRTASTTSAQQWRWRSRSRGEVASAVACCSSTNQRIWRSSRQPSKQRSNAAATWRQVHVTLKHTVLPRLCTTWNFMSELVWNCERVRYDLW